jgi:NTP pyrophosphatase (non-canonical NTP hydrolase)
MKVVSLQELKKEFAQLPPEELVELCIALAKYKKDNKEYAGYLLFESNNKTAFINEIKKEVAEQINELKKQPNLYYVKKTLRAVLRKIIKYCRYLDDKALGADLHIYFCSCLKNSGIPYHKSARLVNLYEAELKKINTLIKTLHEDLQGDYLKELDEISG